MSQTVKLPNYNSPNLRETTWLMADHAAGVTSLNLENSQGFEDPALALIGQPGGEQSEIVTLDEIADDTHSSITEATKFAHQENTPCYVLFGTNIKLYRAPNVDGIAPATSEFEVLDTVAIDADGLTTTYTDNAGGSGYWYRFTYSGTSGETNLEDSPAVRGGNVGIYTTYDGIRQAAGFENAKYITDQMIAQHRAAAQSAIDSALSGRYVVPFADPINPQIELIARTLAAGYLLQEQFPSQPERGKAKIDWATAELRKYQVGEQTLLDVVGTDQAIEENISGEHWPNADTPNTEADQGGSSRYFRMDHVRNDYDRKY